MDIPSRRSLGWRRALDAEDETPPHLKLSTRDTRQLLHTLVAMDTIDCRDPRDLQVTDGKESFSLIELPDFPLLTYHELIAFTEAERAIVRADLKRVFVPVSKDGRLEVFLPIDVLIATLGNVGKKPLFEATGEIHQSAQLLKILPEWRINHEVTEALNTHSLCVEITGWLSNDDARGKLLKAVDGKRRHIIQTFNNRRAQVKKAPLPEVLVTESALTDPLFWN